MSDSIIYLAMYLEDIILELTSYKILCRSADLDLRCLGDLKKYDIFQYQFHDTTIEISKCNTKPSDLVFLDLTYVLDHFMEEDGFYYYDACNLNSDKNILFRTTTLLHDDLYFMVFGDTLPYNNMTISELCYYSPGTELYHILIEKYNMQELGLLNYTHRVNLPTTAIVGEGFNLVNIPTLISLECKILPGLECTFCRIRYLEGDCPMCKSHLWGDPNTDYLYFSKSLNLRYHLPCFLDAKTFRYFKIFTYLCYVKNNDVYFPLKGEWFLSHDEETNKE
jgi:hypothetical protein